MQCISIVLPCYRTAKYLRELYRRLVAACEGCDSEFEIIMVDDGSPDECWEIILELAAGDSRVKGIHLSRNFGQHPAICAGLDVASGDVIVLMDADLQDRPEDIPKLISALNDAVDVVYTVKESNREAFLTRITSQIYHRVFSQLTNTQVPQHIGTLRVFTRRFLRSMYLYTERNILVGPLMFHMGFEHAIVQVARDDRQGGSSSYSFRKRLALAIDSLLSYTDLPHRFLILFGGIVLFVTIAYSIGLVVQRIFVTTLPSGLTLLAILLTMSLGATMIGLGVIGIYVFRVYQQVLHRPRYLISRQINLDAKIDRPFLGSLGA